MTRRLLITADDFGMCHAVNQGTVRAMRQGVVGSTNFLVPCPWFAEAASLARELGLAVGVHLCVTAEWDHLRWGPLTRAPGLTDSQGHFFASFAPLLERATDAEILAEYLAQVERVRSLGIEPTHLDSHMLPSADDGAGALRLKGIIAEVARQTGLRYLYETDATGKLRYFDSELELSGAAWPDVWQRLEALGSGTHHLIGHAGDASPELEGLCSASHPARIWGAPVRVMDLAFFTSDLTRQRLAQLGFELIGVHAIA